MTEQVKKPTVALGMYLDPKTQEHVVVSITFNGLTGEVEKPEEVIRSPYRSEAVEKFKIAAIDKVLYTE